MNYWLIKSDPETYGWKDLIKDGFTIWDGVRNYQARNNLKLIKKEDLILFYHSQTEKQIIGLCKVNKEYFQDPTTDDQKWIAIEISPIKEFSHKLSLESIKNNDDLKNISLVKQQRLSVMPINEKEFNIIINLSK